MRALSSRPFCPCDGRWVSLGYLSAGCRYMTHRIRDAESSLGALFTKLDSLPLFSVRLLLISRFLALCTNSKNPRYRGSFSCEMPRWGRSQLRKSDQNPSMVLTWTSHKPSPSSSLAYAPRP